MYPLLLSKVLKEKIWGGRDFQDVLNMTLPEGVNYGESWEVSTHPKGPSLVLNGDWAGQTLPDILMREGTRLVGDEVLHRFRGIFPLLVKYLDVHDRLSVQVHPNDAFALQHEREWGKSECWYILAASSDAELILGFADGITKEIFGQRIATRTWEGLFRTVKVSAGDFLQIAPGTVHASVTGSILVCEIQQNSDTTYRIWDFDRLENGIPRPLHLEKALQVIDFSSRPVPKSESERVWCKIHGAEQQFLIEDQHYYVTLVKTAKTWSVPSEKNFKIHSILEGQGHVSSSLGVWPITTGQTWFIPSGVATTWEGNFKMLRSWV